MMKAIILHFGVYARPGASFVGGGRQRWNRVKRIDPWPDPTRFKWICQYNHSGYNFVIFMSIVNIFISPFIYVTSRKRHQPS